MALLPKANAKKVFAPSIIILTISVFSTSSQAVMLGLMLGTIFYILALLLTPKLSITLWGFATSITLLVMPLIFFYWSEKLMKIGDSMPFLIKAGIHSEGNRIFLYHELSKLILERPVIGWGLHATPSLTGAIHPHNAGLQIWVEHGLVGIAITIGFLTLLLRKARKLDRKMCALILASLTTFFTISFSDHDLWKNHWVTVQVLTALIFMLSIKSPRQADQETRAKTPLQHQKAS
jgi:O-antigen ligase